MAGTCILVLGMHRSGTSAITRALGALGVDLGDRLMPGLEDNPKGFFEDIDLTRINNALLEALGKRWDSLVLPPWEAVPREIKMEFLSEAKDVIQRRFLKSDCWAFKDPRTVRLLPFWERVLDDLGINKRFLIAYRHPLSVSASLARRDRFDEGKALLLLLQHMLPASQVPGALVVDFDRLLENPSWQFARMARHYGLTRDETAEASFMEHFLDMGLCHARYPHLAWKGREDALGRICKGLHGLFLNLAMDKPGPRYQWEMVKADALAFVDTAKPLMHSIDGLSSEAHEVPPLKRHIAQLEARILELEGQLEYFFEQSQRQRACFDELAALQRQLIHTQHQLPDAFLVKRGRERR